MGVTDDLLRLAYDRTLLGAGRLSWPYLHKILCAWKQQGFRSARDVETAAAAGKLRPGQPAPVQEPLETVILRKLQEKRQSRAVALENRKEELRRLSPEYVENESAMRLFASKMARSRPSEKAKMAQEYQQYVARQREILASLGKPEDWLQDKPDCPLCGDHGYVGTQKCRCLIKALEEQEGYDTLEEVAKTAVDMLNMEAMVKVRGSYGTIVDELKDLPRSYKEAKMAMDVGRIFYAGKRVISYNELGIGRLIYQLPPSL
jgi:hypothetical protein